MPDEPYYYKRDKYEHSEDILEKSDDKKTTQYLSDRHPDVECKQAAQNEI